MSCVNFGTRKYISKDDPSITQHGGWTSTNGDFASNYNAVPQFTVAYETPANANGQWTPSGEGATGLCGAEKSAFPGTNFVGCGDCSGGGDKYKYCTCCISAWNPNNKTQCCDPAGNSLQNDAMSCDPSWCPFSASCINDPVTSDYCKTNTTDANCLANCINFIGNPDKAPSWCSAFVEEYCTAKSANNQTLSPQDQNLCACATHQTAADECLLLTCVDAPTGTFWLTAEQRKNQTDPTYCFQQCKNIAQSVANETSTMNSDIFAKLCSEVTLPPSTVPADQLPSNKKATVPPWYSWNSIKHFFESVTTLQWIIVGVIVFIFIMILSIRALMKYTKET